MNDIDDDSEISFSVKFLGRVEVVSAVGMQILTDAVETLQDPNKEMDEKAKKNKKKAHLFLTRSAIDILEHKTKFMLYTCALSSVSFCAVHPTQPKILGFVSKHPAVDMFHCYILQSKKFSHLLVSIIGDAFQACKQNESLGGDRDLVVEALRHKNKILQRENMELKRRLQAHGEDTDGVHICENETDVDKASSYSGQSTSQVRFFSDDDQVPLHINF
ncbi:PTB domain-containing engulfment adapter protein 1-like isoform X4 [Myxocyprinus asiaticus]|uniref:PTB domain-containing engulfment adapter protein 1-like isoform X4 n=1 Tax=Myxocyprinus asiaticus TaxID=70543 RepID=UPI0022220B68|nr:PTB domain-containing engulfment adapter protein 1-like isoform X4 [Myxocyprinus asiaticus]XP_051515809.1 PTB domain-containing engulfment adapter protein 1-like isoform X4 [Myxocyprinus asiaticus]